MDRRRRARRAAGYLALTGGCATLLVMLPRTLSVPLFAALTLAAWLWVIHRRVIPLNRPVDLARRAILRPPGAAAYPSPPLLSRLRRALPLLELIVITVAALSLIDVIRLNDSHWRMEGTEAEYLTSSAYQAAESLREYGYIPLWQPYLEYGEPLITSPFSFVLNPLSVGPSLLFGALEGIKISVVLYVIFAGWGGWFLGWTLGLGTLGRLVLGLLLVGKGNVHAALTAGFFQLATSQAYMPWISAGLVGIFRFPRRRWPPVLTAVMFALLLWAGNLWYTLPALIAAVVLSLILLARARLDTAVVRRLAFAAGLTLALGAITLVPLWSTRDFILHPDEVGSGESVGLREAAARYIDGSLHNDFLDRYVIYPRTYYQFTVPGWFLALLFVVIPPFVPRNLLSPGVTRRTGLAAMLLLILFTVWGAGGNPVITWLYDRVTLLDHWRFVGRALAAGSFWLALLVALRLDTITRALTALPRRIPIRLTAVRVAIVGLALISWVAVDQLHATWGGYGLMHRSFPTRGECVQWLRQQNPHRELTVFAYDNYGYAQAYLEYRVRLSNIEVAYHLQPRPSTLPAPDVRRRWPQYGMAYDDNQRKFLLENGYRPVDDSPVAYKGYPCLYERDDALSYAFAVYRVVLDYTGSRLEPELTMPVRDVMRRPGRIDLIAWGHHQEPVAVVVEELAFPGWRAWIDGAPAPVESVGGRVGLVLPAGAGEHHVRFEYRPRLFVVSAIMTLAACFLCMIYLTRAERLVRPARHRRLS